MNTAKQVDSLITGWAAEGIIKADVLVRIAEACMGWPYVFGGAGEYCNTVNRKSYADRSTCPAGEAKEIRQKCQRLNGSTDTCSGCKWYPGGVVRFFDCRGFTRWVLKQLGISLQGAGCTSQWNNDANWEVKGEIAEMPRDSVCCVFKINTSDKKTMEHTGFYCGDGRIIHCSGTVKLGSLQEKGWSHYAIPKGLGGAPEPGKKPTLKRGDRGEYVTLMQTKLIQRGYDCGKWGADGAFGAATEAALKAFQRDQGLDADAICGERSWEALESAETPLYTVTIQHVSRSVAEEIVGKYGGTMVQERG